MESVNSFPKNLKRLRKEHLMTQADLAQILGVTKGTVSKWEIGDRLPEIKTITKIAALFQIQLEELIGEEIELELPQTVAMLPGVWVKKGKFKLPIPENDGESYFIEYFVTIRKERDDSSEKSGEDVAASAKGKEGTTL